MSTDEPVKKRIKSQSSIVSYFTSSTVSAVSSSTETKSPSCSSSRTGVDLHPDPDTGLSEGNASSNDDKAPNVSVDYAPSTSRADALPDNDIGYAVGRSITPEQRAIFLRPWRPTSDSQCPSSTHKKSGVERRRRLLLSHLDSFPWLAVSQLSGYEGAFCVPCVLFNNIGSGVGGRSYGRGQIVGKFVSKPLARFDDLTGKQGTLTQHQANSYHKENVIAMEEFKRTFVTRKVHDVRAQVDSAHRREVECNRRILVPIVDTVLTCAKQNIALRGHRDEEGAINADGLDSVGNDGNFRALLRYRIRGGDSTLQEHAKTAAANATYFSAKIQNEVLNVAGSLVKEEVLSRAKKAKFWSLVADETTDLSKREQMVIILRYVLSDDDNHWICYEDPVAVLDLFASWDDSGEEVRLSGKFIADIIMKTLSDFQMDFGYCVGQGFDGASALSSQRVGASAAIMEIAKNAHYYHCAVHCLNLSASRSVSVPAVRHAQDVIMQTSQCFNSSAKRTALLKKCVDEAEDTRISKNRLKTLCTTRFIERHTAITSIRNLLPFVVQALEQMKQWRTSDTRSSAHTLSNSLLKGDFMISLLILEEISAVLLPLTRTLQAKGLDLVQAMTGVSDLLLELRKLRSDTVFHKIYETACILAESLGVVILQPRLPGRSVYRATAGVGDCGDSEAYYRSNVFFPTIDTVITDIELRFGANQKKAASLASLVPTFIRYCEGEDENQWLQLESGLMTYATYFLDSFTVIKAEYFLWRRRWEHTPQENRPSSALSSLDYTAQFPNIATALQILATIPISTAEAERVFSKVTKTLTAIRSTMSEIRLESLILLQVHREMTPSVDSVIDRFASTSSRRLKLNI